MITIKHSAQSVTVHSKMKPNDYFYLVGMTKPRYPMPAIKYETTFTWYVAIRNLTQGVLAYWYA